MPINSEEVTKMIDKLANPKSGLTTALEEDALVIIKKLQKALDNSDEEFSIKHLKTIENVFSTIVFEPDDGANICGVLIRKLKSLDTNKIMCPYCNCTFKPKE